MLRTYNTTRSVFGQNFILTKHKHTNTCLQVRIQDFKLGEGGALKKIAPSGGRPENFWGISCEKSRFYAKKSYYFQLRREARKVLRYFVYKITILRQKIILFPILGGVRAGCGPHWIRPSTDNNTFSELLFLRVQKM